MTKVSNGGVLIAPSPGEVEKIREMSTKLVENPLDKSQYILTDSEKGIQMTLTPALFKVLVRAAQALAQGQSVAILHYDQELTTQQAADLLNVSRPYLIKLLESGKIRYRKVGTHRRIRLRDLEEYKRSRDAQRRAALLELVRISDSLGLYDEEDSETQSKSE